MNPGIPKPKASAAIVVREHRGQAFYEAKFRYHGAQIKRRIGPAWLDLDRETGEWRPRRGRVPDDSYDERRAHVAAARLVADYTADAEDHERVARERLTRGVTFREVAHAYLKWLAEVKGAKPSTLRDHQSVLAEPGILYRRGAGKTLGHVMTALGDRHAAEVTTRDVEALLATISKTGASPRTVNKHRALISAVYNYGSRKATFALPANPASEADKRREPHPGALAYYTPEDVEALARALADGSHRETTKRQIDDPEERAARAGEDHQDAELIRVAAYAGLRLGELLALRWRDVDFAGHALTVGRAMSAGIESSTKSGRVRRVPLPDQAADALDRLSRREDFTAPSERVFCNRFGRPLDGSALRRRYKRAQAAAGLQPLRFHDLRHTYGSLLAAAGVDLVTVQAAMGHAALATTGRYLHARPASEIAERFTRVFAAGKTRIDDSVGRSQREPVSIDA
jgi:integrase